MNKQFETLAIIGKRAEMSRISEEARLEITNLIEQVRDEFEAMYEGAVENENFHNLEEETDLNFEGYDDTSAVVDFEDTAEPFNWASFRGSVNHKEELFDSNFKPKKEGVYDMDQFNNQS